MAGNADDILRRFGSIIEKKMGRSSLEGPSYSSAYTQFKQEMAPDLSRYERWCHSLGNMIKLKVSEKDEKKVKRFLEIAHLDVQPWQALTLSVMVFLSVFFLGVLISVAAALIKGSFAAFPFLFFFLVLIFSLFLFKFVGGYPERLANKWRLKASSQMVPAILYVVVYMRHTPNLEKAIAFASQHLQYPLALDFKKVFYDVEVGKFSTIKESLDSYLDSWKDYSTEFIESFHLIEGSLLEPDNARRISSLEKSLQVILDGVYEKMLKFTHNVKSPLTNVYMLGVVLPILGLALLPLASVMIGGILKSVHVFILFNLVIPFFVLYLIDNITRLRPGGYGESELLERNPLYSKYKDNSVYFTAFFICLPFFILGFLPLIFQYTPIPVFLGLEKDYSFAELGLGFFKDEMFFGFISSGAGVSGPFGVGALVLSMFIPLGLALFFSMVFGSKTGELIKERERTRELEGEFGSSLFQLGNQLGNGIPPELVFRRLAESSKGLKTSDFFQKVDFNIRRGGMSVEKAIFDPKRGALISYPSDLIATSMRVLVESSKKGLRIAAVSLMSISEYLKNIHKITIRLRDLLAEVTSDMKSNMTFLAPLLAGIVIALSAMITSILSRLQISDIGEAGIAGVGNLVTILEIFDLSSMIPPYYLQIAIGIYLVQIAFILTGVLVSVDSGEDKLERVNKTGRNLKKGILFYFITAFFATLALFILVSVVLGNIV
jgi:hypothetical protein